MTRATETEAYWRDEFTVTEKEETALQEHFIQQNKPLPTDAITRFLMERQHAGANKALQASKGSYNPTASYEVGEHIAFPSLGDEVGEVIGSRAGENVRYGTFRVIKVHFPGLGQTHEFATELSNEYSTMMDVVEAPPMGIDELYKRFGHYALEEVEAALEASDAFLFRDNQWLPRLLLVDFHEGHRNIADAMIDIMGEATSAADLLKEIPIQEQSSDEVKQFSLDHALSQDKRFRNVGSGEAPLWYLQRLS